jgi:ankyrin repeat protein
MLRKYIPLLIMFFLLNCIVYATESEDTKSRFIDNNDGTVTDTKTKLMWQKKDDGKRRTFNDAVTYCKKLKLSGYSDWRLPNQDEVDDALREVLHRQPRDKTIMSVPRGEITIWVDYYWSNDPKVVIPFNLVSGMSMSLSDFDETARFYVRAVRAIIPATKKESLPSTSFALIEDDLLKAASNGEIEKVRSLLNKGANVNAKDKDGVTAMMWASEKGQTEIVNILLSKGAEVNARENNSGMTALMVAAAEGHTAIVEALLAKGADVNAKDYNLGATPLMGAAEYGYVNIIRTLIAKGADVNAKDKKNRTALMMASTNGHTSTVQALLLAGADVNVKDTQFGATALMGASANGHAAIVEALLEKGANLNEKSNSGMTTLDIAKSKGESNVVQLLEKANSKKQAVNNTKDNSTIADPNKDLLDAIKKGDANSVKTILDKGADVNAKDENGFTGLIMASTRGDIVIARILLAKGADINAKEAKYGFTAMIVASIQRYIEIVKILLANGADVDIKSSNGDTALMVASGKGYTEIVKALLAKNADVNIKDYKDGWTALMRASLGGYVEIVKALLVNNADVDAKDNSGITALMIASSEGYTEIVRALLAENADVNAKSNNGKTALMGASQNGHTEIVQILIDNGANVNAKTIDGATALMWATPMGHIDIVKALLDKGADVNADIAGKTALMMATERGFPEIVKLLKKAGSKKNKLPDVENEFTGTISEVSALLGTGDMPSIEKVSLILKEYTNKTFYVTSSDAYKYGLLVPENISNPYFVLATAAKGKGWKVKLITDGKESTGYDSAKGKFISYNVISLEKLGEEPIPETTDKKEKDRR